MENQADASGPPVILVCGRKNVGKSTLNRFLVNNLLNRYESVMHLECDVGQGEFTPAGIASLTMVDAPLLGPPFTHIRRPERFLSIA
jgi:polynucleotide 5'-hydroxyl-kinase GRC3/NOL9